MNDKFQHALVCYSIVLTGAFIGYWFLGVLVALLFAFGKEWLDSRKGGSGWDWWDISADFIGMDLALILNIIMGVYR